MLSLPVISLNLWSDTNGASSKGRRLGEIGRLISEDNTSLIGVQEGDTDWLQELGQNVLPKRPDIQIYFAAGDCEADSTHGVPVHKQRLHEGNIPKSFYGVAFLFEGELFNPRAFHYSNHWGTRAEEVEKISGFQRDWVQKGGAVIQPLKVPGQIGASLTPRNTVLIAELYELTIAVTHGPWSANNGIPTNHQIAGFENLLDILKRESVDVVLADSNTHSECEGSLYTLLEKEGFASAFEASQPTLDKKYFRIQALRNLSVDIVMYRPQKVSLHEKRIIEGVSDHFALSATFSLE